MEAAGEVEGGGGRWREVEGCGMIWGDMEGSGGRFHRKDSREAFDEVGTERCVSSDVA